MYPQNHTNMNKLTKVFLTALICICTQNLFAQIEITPFGGWHWTGKVPAYRQNIKVSDEGNYGIRVGATVRPQVVAEFEWSHTSNAAMGREYLINGNLGDFVTVPLRMNYYMLGIQYESTFDDVLIPYGLVNFGLMNIAADSFNNYGSVSEIFFTAGVGGGFKYFFSEHVGIRLQARLLFPMQFGGVGFGCGIGTGGGGCGAGVSTYTSIIQGDFTGGIVLKFGE